MGTITFGGDSPKAICCISEGPPRIRDMRVGEFVAMVLAFGGAEIVALFPIFLGLVFAS